MSSHRRARGAETQRLVASMFARTYWPHCTDAGAGRNGPDLLGVPGLSVEIKARRELSIPAGLRQAAAGGGLPILIHRPDGAGPATLEDWPATFRLADALELLHAAGYGSAQ